MSFELESAFIGAVVSALGSYLLILRHEKQDVKKAFVAFESFHLQFGKPNSATDLAVAKETLRDITAMILVNGHESTVKHFMIYSGKIELMLIKSVSGTTFSAITPELKKHIDEAREDLQKFVLL